MIEALVAWLTSNVFTLDCVLMWLGIGCALLGVLAWIALLVFRGRPRKRVERP